MHLTPSNHPKKLESLEPCGKRLWYMTMRCGSNKASQVCYPLQSNQISKTNKVVCFQWIERDALCKREIKPLVPECLFRVHNLNPNTAAVTRNVQPLLRLSAADQGRRWVMTSPTSHQPLPWMGIEQTCVPLGRPDNHTRTAPPCLNTSGPGTPTPASHPTH